ncbi:MAG: 4-carboxy-4-hydroxy-2-oxoadipate aldolase/oxaloacetate decarboxylase [Alphaproteobacteria bacterium]|nr:4-carboxy-4-hydroxy-2-oxoadipate aldolase/oxaloacetate decarboxylase [Alphaproteobacteria bacterium]MDX5368175.1 4-carboxy-4-hydroxy-2-oxoadipate aldolase/oxaloacetate decarboxylase [Alphaproteobacteria bacterium]MDX5462991.1 4-carboxy-4-hydroxy-2-oxoadipate aldolase/oxaloacetate decarboxylase [Alphaproteobacteria bacterium]
MAASRVHLRVNRVSAAVCADAAAASVSDVHEGMEISDARRCLMSPRMRPLNRGLRIAGPAVTAYCAPGDNLMMHRALYLAEPGDVLVVVCQSETSGAQWGDMAARYALKKGLAGVVVQGAIRDTDELERLRFPVWSTAVSPIRPAKTGDGAVNVPVSCDGVIVTPGDLILADGDGVLCVPRDVAADAVAAARKRMSREDEVAAAIEGGAHLWDLAKLQGYYEALDVEEIDAPWGGEPGR